VVGTSSLRLRVAFRTVSLTGVLSESSETQSNLCESVRWQTQTPRGLTLRHLFIHS
jgi:hypothetical protein